MKLRLFILLTALAQVHADPPLPKSNFKNISFKQVATFDHFPEGPSYRRSDGSYFFSGNIALTRIDPGGKLHRVLDKPGGGGTHFLPDGSVLLVGSSGLRRIYPDGRISLLADGKETGDGNDLSVGKFGEIYFSVHAKGIYRLTPGPEGAITQVSEKGTNGLEVDPSGKWLYVVGGGVQRYPINGATQALGKREMVARLPKSQGGGDGCAFDTQGNFYTMHFGTGVIRVIDPTKQALIATIPTGITPATNLTFGGPKNNELFITAGAPKHKNCQILKATTTITGFPGHPGSTTYPEIRIEKQKANVSAFKKN